MTFPRSAVILLVALGCSREDHGAPGPSHAKASASASPTTSATAKGPALEDGDLVLQTSKSSQSLAIQLATHSKLSHVGIVYFDGGRPLVFEAIGPVTSTPLAAWIARGEGGHFVAKRLADRTKLESPTLQAMRAAGRRYAGKAYDFAFEWSDDRIYCSELVWKNFHEGAGIDLAPLAKLRDFDLTNPTVAAAVHQRYGANVPLDETVIAPQSLADSPLLVTVVEK